MLGKSNTLRGVWGVSPPYNRVLNIHTIWGVLGGLPLTWAKPTYNTLRGVWGVSPPYNRVLNIHTIWFALSAEDFSQNKSEIDQRSAIVDAKFEVINNSMGEIHEKLAKLTVAMNSFSDLYIHEIE